MICARCDQRIQPGQDYETRDHFAASGAGCTIYLHKELCPLPRTTRTT